MKAPPRESAAVECAPAAPKFQKMNRCRRRSQFAAFRNAGSWLRWSLAAGRKFDRREMCAGDCKAIGVGSGTDAQTGIFTGADLSHRTCSNEPCIPTRGTKVPDRPEWIHEIKHDGYRLIIQRDGTRVRLMANP
jgi:hypothetical protein